MIPAGVVAVASGAVTPLGAGTWWKRGISLQAWSQELPEMTSPRAVLGAAQQGRLFQTMHVSTHCQAQAALDMGVGAVRGVQRAEDATKDKDGSVRANISYMTVCPGAAQPPRTPSLQNGLRGEGVRAFRQVLQRRGTRTRACLSPYLCVPMSTSRGLQLAIGSCDCGG